MALIVPGKTKCPICKGVFDGQTRTIGFPHFIREPEHPLWEYSDSAMHLACFLDWPKADAFRLAFAEASKVMHPRFPQTMLADGSIIDDPSLDEYPPVIEPDP